MNSKKTQPEQVLNDPEIWRIPVVLPSNPLKELNCYVIQTDAGNLVIDTGFNRPECRSALWNGIRELGLNMSKTSLFLTHLHTDHIGLVQDFVNLGCIIYMGTVDYTCFCDSRKASLWKYMEDLYEKEGFPKNELARQANENQARKYAPPQIFPAVMLDDGECVPLGDLEIRCVCTPGHTPGHTVLYLPESQVLFSGDHILFNITPNISVWRDVPDPLADYLESLQKMKKFPIRFTFPSHRSYGENVYERIDQLIAHHRERLTEILRAVSNVPQSSAYQIASQISWSVHGKSWSGIPPHQRWFAMGETLAHLNYLTVRGEVHRVEMVQGVYYQAQ